MLLSEIEIYQKLALPDLTKTVSELSSQYFLRFGKFQPSLAYKSVAYKKEA